MVPYTPFIFILLCLALLASAETLTSTECSREHMVEAVRSASYCHPMVKVVKLEIPGNGSYSQVGNSNGSETTTRSPSPLTGLQLNPSE